MASLVGQFTLGGEIIARGVGLSLMQRGEQSKTPSQSAAGFAENRKRNSKRYGYGGE